jgi:uncharacterized protein YdhG (YjbR/CyaY superfamily)
MTRHLDVDTYIASFPPATQRKLQQLRRLIKKHAPDAVECISYNMPAYKMGKPLIYFAGYANHIGLYPTGKGIEAIKEDLAGYTWSKGAVQFPLDQPLPVLLITKIIRLRRDHLR